jgi:hypothetical protein
MADMLPDKETDAGAGAKSDAPSRQPTSAHGGGRNLSTKKIKVFPKM